MGCQYKPGGLWREHGKRYACPSGLYHLKLTSPNYAAIACEVLARRVVHLAPSDKTVSMLSTRFRFKEVDEDISEKASALELAVDSHWYAFAPLPCLPRSHSFAQYDLPIFHGGAGW